MTASGSAERHTERESQTVQITDSLFGAAVLRAKTPALVGFLAPWCGPCRQVASILEELAEEHAGRLLVARIDTDEHEKQAATYEVRGLPTMILFRHGVEEDRLVGALPKPSLDLWIERVLSD